ncbi:DUF3592 domain-containing protein [Paraburkholderia sp. BL17N1]|uniref:DUF3592 domain-containing protein n=1 Tax=Paraburkholderia sp. BL17N1 TaxID=1938798 RepID=UPI000EB00422|nr:DUF3592 domain-containing protein [Paraburkholderia sp. BL17N1]RKR43601.1 uncharacterized protein DUF3592 [Paraburkholderia sp. BL17N1]
MMNSTVAQSPYSRSTLVILTLSLGALLFSLFWLVSSLMTTHRMAVAEGTVVSYDQGGRSWRSYQPVIVFTTAHGDREQITGQTSSTRPAYDIGQTLRVFYDPTDPAHSAIIDDFGQRWFPIGVVMLLSVVFSAIGAVMFVIERGKVKQATPLSYLQARRKRGRQNLLVCLIPIVIGAGFLLGAAASAMRERQIIGSYKRTTGRVVEVQEAQRPYQPRAHMYSAIVAFKTETGKEVSFAQGSSSSHNDLESGDEVDVLYDANTPDRAMIDSFWEHWGLPAILFAIGLPFLAVGVFFISTVDFSGGRYSKRT